MQLDDAYANAAYIDGSDDYPARWVAVAAAFRAGAVCELDVPYGESARQRVDIFHPPRLAHGTVIFVHGGYWKAFDKSYWSHLAAGPLAHGWAVAMPSYDLCPDVRISDITQQIAQAVGFVAARMPGSMRLAGHSAGGHLVARMLDPALTREWQARIASVVPISPVADLTPLLQTRMNDILGLDADEARAESPVHQPAPIVPVTTWVGGEERQVFLEQAAALAQAWGCENVVVPGKHHFDIIDALADPDSALMQRLLGLDS